MEHFTVCTTDNRELPGIIGAEEIIREYPILAAASRELRQIHSTPLYGPRRFGEGGHSDPTASVACRELPPDEQRKYDAIRQTIRRTNYHKNGNARLTLIDLLYWKRTHTLAEAAKAISCLEQEAQQYRNEFICAVKEALGISNCEGCRHYRHLLPTTMACHYCWDIQCLRIHDVDGCDSKELDDALCPYYEEEVI